MSDEVQGVPEEESHVEDIDTDNGGTPSLEEPFDAVRVSPYAVAAFALSLLGFWEVPLFTLPPLSDVPVQSLLAFVPTIVAAVLALWLAGRGEEEIFVSDGRLGGVGFCRAARAVSVVALGFVALALVIGLWARMSDVVRFDV